MSCSGNGLIGGAGGVPRLPNNPHLVTVTSVPQDPANTGAVTTHDIDGHRTL